MTKHELPLIEISGYWKDDVLNTFEGYLVKQTNDVWEEEDDSIFFYGLTWNEIQECLNKETAQDFVITNAYNPEMKYE